MRSALLLLLCWLTQAAHAELRPLHRFALVAGNNQGGDDTRPLVFATEDARKMHALLLRLGSVKSEDATLLLDASSEDFLEALTALEQRAQAARAAGARTALLVYYSGHAKDGALRMGEGRLGFDALKKRISSSPAEVRIGIFDSCRSGALTRSKGARRAPAFDIDANLGQEAKGLVLLTSSASDEDSQESDALGGSYFSHHLVSGLLGDADRSANGQVTLFEAYSYAYERTVADTADSAAGPQHPTFSYDLAGNGDLVLTDLGTRKEGVRLPAEAPEGAYYFIDRRGFVAAELHKTGGVARQVALGPGRYRVKRRLPDRLRMGDVEVSSGQLALLDERTLRDAPFSDDPVKGLARRMDPRWSMGLAGGYQSFLDAPTRDTLFPSVPLVGVEATLQHYLRRDWIWGFDLAAGASRHQLQVESLAGLSYRYSVLSVGSSLLVQWPLGDFAPFAGARLAYLVMSRSFEDAQVPEQRFSMLSPGLVGGVRYQLLTSLSATARARLHYLLYNVDAQRSLGYWELAGLLSYEL